MTSHTTERRQEYLGRLRTDPRVREVYQDDDYWWVWLNEGYRAAKPARVFHGMRWTTDDRLILARTLAGAWRQLNTPRKASTAR